MHVNRITERIAAGILLLSAVGVAQGRFLTQEIGAPTDGPVLALAGSDQIAAVGSNLLAIGEGGAWQRVATPPTLYGFRGLAMAGGRCYVGAAGDFGYVEPDPATGDWRYISLRRGVEIWDVAATTDGVWFVGDQQVWRYDGSALQTWPLPCSPRLIAIRPETGRLWLYQPGHGLLRLTDHPETVSPDEFLPGRPVLWALTRGGACWLGTSDGVFGQRGPGAAWQRLPGLSAALDGTLPVSGIWRADGSAAIATYAGGVLFVDPTTDRLLGRTDRTRGLPSDQVQAIWDGPGGLWVGSAGGATRVKTKTRFWSDREGLADRPITRVLGTDHGPVAIGPEGVWQIAADVVPLPRTKTVLREAIVWRGDVWLAGVGGIWKREGTAWRQVYFTGNEILALAGTVEGMVALDGRKPVVLHSGAHGDWAAKTLAENLGDTPVGIVTRPDGNGEEVWVALWSGTVNVYRWARDGRWQLRASFQPGHGLPDDVGRITQMTRVGHRMVVFAESETGSVILGVEQDGGASRFVPMLPGFGGVVAAPDAPFWVVRRSETALPAIVRVRADGSWDPVSIGGLEALGTISSLSSVDGELWIGGANGLLAAAPGPAPAPPAVDLRVEKTPEGWHLSARSPAALGGEEILYRLGSGSTEPRGESEKWLNDLGPGEHDVSAAAVDRWGRNGPERAARISVPRPWWWSPAAWIAYGVVFVAIGWSYAQVRSRRLERRNAQLDALVRERTRQLAERTRELELVDAAKTEFLESLSHEIRNPLNGIRGLTGLLQAKSTHAEERNLMASLAACTQALTRTFDEVLTFARLEAGVLSVRRRPFSLAALLDELLSLHAEPARQAGCALLLSAPGDLPERFVGDAEKIATVLGNFLGNAIKYAPGAPIRVEVNASAPGGAPGRERVDVTVAVRDFGPGVPEAEQSLLFRKFVRGSGAKARRVPGTGLGLASCRALAERMGGTVGLESPPPATAEEPHPGGAVFFLKLWLRVAPPPEPAPALPDLGAAMPRAMIVDDQAYNRRVAVSLAEQLGLRPAAAADGHEALARATHETFAVWFIDWEMPGLRGDAIAREIRARPAGAEAILIATTGHDSSQVKADCVAAGIDAFVVKPYDAWALHAAIEEVRTARAAAGRPTGWNIRPATETPAPPGAVEEFGGEVFDLVGGEDERAEAIREYLVSLDDEHRAFDAACAAGDWSEAIRRAHRLRSHAGLVRAPRLREAAGALEAEAANATPERRSDLQHHLAREIGRLRGFVAALGESPPSASPSDEMAQLLHREKTP